MCYGQFVVCVDSSTYALTLTPSIDQAPITKHTSIKTQQVLLYKFIIHLQVHHSSTSHSNAFGLRSSGMPGIHANCDSGIPYWLAMAGAALAHAPAPGFGKQQLQHTHLVAPLSSCCHSPHRIAAAHHARHTLRPGITCLGQKDASVHTSNY